MPDIIDTILKHEGGYQNSPDDDANFVGDKMVGTNWGITPETLAKHRGISKRQLSAKDMMKLSQEEAREIYNNQYVKPFEAIPEGPLKNNLIDMGVNAGPARAVKLLQESIGAKVDGKLGPKTWKAVEKSGFNTNDYADARIGYYQRIAQKNPKLGTFIDGWTNRANSFRDTK